MLLGLLLIHSYDALGSSSNSAATSSPAASSSLAANSGLPANGPAVSNGVPVYFDDFTVEQQSYIVAVNDFYPFGGSHDQESMIGVANKYKYQGKELQAELGLGLYDFHARQYDPLLGRFVSTDPAGQFASGYVGMGNSPVVMVDPNGEFAFVPILVAAAYGAAIGAGTSAVVYSATALATGNFDWKDFGKSAAFGAVSGAIGGGIGGAFANSAFAQTVGFNILSNTASTVAGTAILGGDITAGTVIGGVAGGFVGSAIPGFTGVKGGALANTGAEIGYSAVKGGLTGAVTGGIAAGVDGGDVGQGIVQGAKYGAIGGAALVALNVATLGPAYKPNQKYGNFGKHDPVYRTGTFLTRALAGEGSGITLGRNIVTHEFKPGFSLFGQKVNVPHANNWLRAHETAHYAQQINVGFSRFYARTL